MKGIRNMLIHDERVLWQQFETHQKS